MKLGLMNMYNILSNQVSETFAFRKVTIGTITETFMCKLFAPKFVSQKYINTHDGVFQNFYFLSIQIRYIRLNSKNYLFLQQIIYQTYLIHNFVTYFKTSKCIMPNGLHSKTQLNIDRNNLYSIKWLCTFNNQNIYHTTL